MSSFKKLFVAILNKLDGIFAESIALKKGLRSGKQECGTGV